MLTRKHPSEASARTIIQIHLFPVFYNNRVGRFRKHIWKFICLLPFLNKFLKAYQFNSGYISATSFRRIQANAQEYCDIKPTFGILIDQFTILRFFSNTCVR